MAKARKQNKGDDVPNPNSVANRDVMQRLNFLYQASVYLHSISQHPAESSHDAKPEQLTASTAPTSTAAEPPKDPPARRPHKTTSTTALSRSYVGSMKAIGRKTVVKMDPSVKRTLCKGCGIVLIPGSTATVRIKPSSSHGHAVTYTCTTCKTSRRIAAPCLYSGTGDDRSGIPKEISNAINMDIDHHVEGVSRSVSREKRKKRKKRPVSRRQMLSQQPGHIVFRGNEQITLEDE